MKKIIIGAMMCAAVMVPLLTSCEDMLETKNFTDMPFDALIITFQDI